MKKYIVNITDKALSDLSEIVNYISDSLFAPDAAHRLYIRIADEIESLDEFPERYAVVLSEPEHSMKIRRTSVDNYSIFYHVGENVTILRILYSASDISERLLSGR